MHYPHFFFNLCLGKVIRSVKTNPVTKFDTAKQCLLCADRVSLLGHAAKHVAETAGDMTNVTVQIGLRPKCIQNQICD